MTLGRSLLALLLMAAPLLLAAAPPRSPPGERLVALDDREAIRIALRDYGRLLDERRAAGREVAGGECADHRGRAVNRQLPPST